MAQSNTLSLKVHSAIAKALVDNGVDIMFGLIGDANLFMVDSYVRQYGGKFVAAANEAGATLMALGYATASGTIGVATVTLGPGLANTIAALVEGVKGGTPIVLLCGDASFEDHDESPKISQRDFVVVTGAGFEQLRAPETLSQDIATAFRRAAVERRPIALNMPRGFQWKDVEYKAIRYKVPDRRAFVPASADLDDAIGIIATAKRPLVLAGRGAIHPGAKAGLLQLAARIEAPLATTLKAKELFRGEQYDLGIFGTLSTPATLDVIMASDCIIAFGAGLNGYTTSRGTLVKGKRVVQVSLDQGDIGRYLQPDAGVVGEPALVAGTIIGWLDKAETVPSGFRNEAFSQMNQHGGPASRVAAGVRVGTIDISLALRRLNEAVPADRLVVTDGGRFLGQSWTLLQVSDPHCFVYGLNFGAIGMGLSQAIGASFTAGKRPTLAITGDGGFMLGGMIEFNTAVRHGCNIIVVVCNDGSYGAEHVQFRDRNMDPGLSVFEWPDFGPVATALGGTGVTVRSEGDLESAVQAISSRKGPLLIDLKLDPDSMPRLPH